MLMLIANTDTDASLESRKGKTITIIIRPHLVKFFGVPSTLSVPIASFQGLRTLPVPCLSVERVYS